MDRTTYLNEVATWVKNYADLSQQIRDARTAYKQAQRADSSSWKELRAYESLKEDARVALTDREELKETARYEWEQRQLARQAA